MQYMWDHGCKFGQLDRPKDVYMRRFGNGGLSGMMRFYAGPSGMKKRWILPSFVALRYSTREDDPNHEHGGAVEFDSPKDLIDQVQGALEDFLGEKAQQVIRARYYVMVLPAKREEMYIDAIRRTQAQVLQQLIAAAVTLGVTAGQVIAPLITRAITGDSGVIGTNSTR